MREKRNSLKHFWMPATTIGLALLILICCLDPAGGLAQSRPKAAITGGEVQGQLIEGAGARFLGIPYAQPPVGDLRWREPMPVKAWSGVRDATKYGSPCAQMGQKGFSGNEDCLYLNVFAPEWPVKSQVPVMVWLHGGANAVGSAGSPTFEGISLIRRGVVLAPDNDQVTGDLSGAASRWVEQRYPNHPVVLWTSGPAGDQNPKYMSWGPTYVGNKATEPGFPLNDALGQILGEEIARVSENMGPRTSNIKIFAAEKVVTCPAKPPARAVGQPAAAGEPLATPGNVDLRLGLIMLNDIALAGVQSEILTNIYYHLKQDSPFTNTIMVTHNFGSMGYIPEDAAYDKPMFEVNGTRFARGCAEGQIVKGILEMMGQNK